MPCTSHFYGSFHIACFLAFLDPCIFSAAYALEHHHSKSDTLCSHHDYLSNALEGRMYHTCGFAIGCNFAVHSSIHTDYRVCRLMNHNCLSMFCSPYMACNQWRCHLALWSRIVLEGLAQVGTLGMRDMLPAHQGTQW